VNFWANKLMCTKAKRKCFLTGLRDNVTLSAGRDLAKQHSSTNYEITESIEEADIVLYLEHGYIGLAEVPRLIKSTRRAESALHFLFSESDWPFPVLPGAYPSLYKPCSWAHSWCFLPRPSIVDSNAHLFSSEPRFLFSFLGRGSTHPVRKKLLLLDKANSPCLDLADAPERFPDFDYSRSYWTLMADSKFVLCPRGFGASSIRIFEAMSVGRVPVVIGDQWQRPPGVPWDKLCVFVPERDVMRTPSILRRLEDDALNMGKLARRMFNRYFAPSVFFDRLLIAMEARYSECEFTTPSNLLRIGRAIGSREIRTVGSQAKSLIVESLRSLVVR
jgi:hypothetical protein